MASTQSSYQYANVPATTTYDDKESPHEYGDPQQQQQSPFDFRHDASYYTSTLVERGRRNPCMVGSVIVIFLLLIASHHHKHPSTEKPTPRWPPMPTDESPSPTNGGDNATVPVAVVPAASNPDLKSSTNADVISGKSSTAEPLLAYLLSYPMSGTSYTLSLIRSLPPHSLTRPSNAATNYGIEAPVRPDTKDNYPVFANSPQGPFYLTPINDQEADRYVVSLSHCTGHCPNCSVAQFMESESSFEEACRTTHYYNYTDSNQKYMVGVYNSSLPKKAIHLVRDPLNNIVSLFHLERHERERRGEDAWLKDYPNDMIGFQHWCLQLNAAYEVEESQSKYFSTQLRSQMKKVPCHDEVYKYVQWHNYVHQTFVEMTQSAVPISTIYYEEFGTKLLDVAQELSTFLELKNPLDAGTLELSKLPKFLEGKSYHEFYTDEQIQDFWELVELLAVKGVWNNILGRYHMT